jgi:hypothetical protein
MGLRDVDDVLGRPFCALNKAAGYAATLMGEEDLTIGGRSTQ